MRLVDNATARVELFWSLLLKRQQTFNLITCSVSQNLSKLPKQYREKNIFCCPIKQHQCTTFIKPKCLLVSDRKISINVEPCILGNTFLQTSVPKSLVVVCQHQWYLEHLFQCIFNLFYSEYLGIKVYQNRDHQYPIEPGGYATNDILTGHRQCTMRGNGALVMRH